MNCQFCTVDPNKIIYENKWCVVTVCPVCGRIASVAKEHNNLKIWHEMSTISTVLSSVADAFMSIFGVKFYYLLTDVCSGASDYTHFRTHIWVYEVGEEVTDVNPRSDPTEVRAVAK